MNARKLKDCLLPVEQLLTASPETVGRQLLHFFAAIQEPDRRRNVMQTQYIGGPHPTKDFPPQYQPAVTRVLLEGWQWLQSESLIIQEGTGPAFGLTRKGEDAVRQPAGPPPVAGSARQKAKEEVVPVVEADPSKVFVVYGRNVAARQALFEFLRAIGLHPLEWEQIVQATGEASPYVGDVLEQGFKMAQAVVVLFTPDDEARLRSEYRRDDDPDYEGELTGQPRQNVLLEAGMALALHPSRTVIAEVGTLRPASDILGRHTVRIKDSVASRQALAQRLNTAGCAGSLGGTDWHTAGDFGEAIAVAARSPSGSSVTVDDRKSDPLGYLDGLSPDELYRIAGALIENRQTIHCGRNDLVAVSLAFKGLIVPIPHESDLKNIERPYLFPIGVWDRLCKIRDEIVMRSIAANLSRLDRSGHLGFIDSRLETLNSAERKWLRAVLDARDCELKLGRDFMRHGEDHDALSSLMDRYMIGIKDGSRFQPDRTILLTPSARQLKELLIAAAN